MFASKDVFLTPPSTGGYTIARSVRLRSSASAYFNRTLTTPTNNTTWTISAWVKRGSLGVAQTLFGAAQQSIEWVAGNGISIYSAGNPVATSTAVYRDPSAWYHFVINSNGTTVTVYANNQSVLTYTGTLTSINSAISHTIGKYANSSADYLDGYITEINFIDGQALTPSSFGSTNAITGVWQPAKYTGTYGTNGFYLNFSDNSAVTTSSNVGIGKDFSGNGNYWTSNSISVTAGVTYDSMTDVPTLTSATAANYCVLNPLDKATSFTTADGNLSFTPVNTSDLYSCRSTIQIPSTGKWIWQVTNTNSAYMITAGLLSGSTALTAQQTVSCAGMTVGAIGTFFSTTQWMNTTTSWSVTNIGNGDTLVIAYDADAGKIWFGRVASGGTTVTWYNTSGTADPSTGTDPRASGITAGGWFAGFGTYYTPSGASANFGQRPFAFTNTPTGFVALNTWNLPDSTIKNGAGYMYPVLRTGFGASGGSVTSLAFQPDLIWEKTRNLTGDHFLVDSVRTVSKTLSANTTTAEATNATYFTSFNSNGYSLGSGDWSSSYTLVDWCWKAGTTSASNTNGSITSTVSVGATQGFSVVTYTGTGANATVGHGLGVAPSMIIVKKRSGTDSWAVYNSNLTSAAYALILNSTSAQQSIPTYWNSTAPTSSVFTVSTDSAVNASTSTYVAYCFAAVAGYSAFGSYTGNGSTDGPFVYLGFRPRFVMIKETTAASTSDWVMHDTSRAQYNADDYRLLANSSGAELNTGFPIDELSNGFKVRNTGNGTNRSAGTYIYMAFAESPFKTSLAR